MKFLYIKISLIAFSFLFLSCKKQETAPDAVEPNPLKIYTAEGISVKSYDYSGLEHFLTQENDTTYIVNFWATWCVPCIQELPYFEEINKKYASAKVKTLLVSLDMAKTVETRLIPFIKEKKLQLHVVLLRDPDANSWISKVNENWTGAIPATVIYNKDQRKFYEKPFTYEELETELKSFIK